MSKQTELAQVADTITVNSGNVGIGTSSPNQPLTVATNSSAQGINITGRSSDDRAYMFFSDNNGTTYRGSIHTIPVDNRFNINAYSGENITFSNNGAEKVRLDASGNLLVGTTTNSSSNNGVTAGNSGLITATRTSNYSAIFNRKTSDGDIVQFRKDGASMGSISTVASNLLIGKVSGLSFQNNDVICPVRNGSRADNVIDLGFSSIRFDDVYATNGTIQTSDRNEKQDIAELTDAEQRVAVAAKGLMRKFRWRDAVEAKGDDARIHFGIIAQDLQAAFAAEGLDAGRYAMFMSNTWWEHDVEVPAVEAVAEVLDDDGNVVTEAVEAVDAYTRTDTYDTQEEAPEGATERTRLGVRYSELLAFIIGAL